MLVRLFISLACLLASFTTARACTPVPLTEPHTGRAYNNYYGKPSLQTKSFLGDDKFVAIVKTRRVKKKRSLYDGTAMNRLSFKHIENLYGNVNKLSEADYPDDKKDKSKTTEKHNTLDFNFWETLDIQSPVTELGVMVHDGNCRHLEPRLILRPKSLYLVFGYVYDDKTTITEAVQIKSRRDPIVGAFRSVINDDVDAPNKMSPETYFKNMAGFAQVNIVQCPKKSDFRYKDSKFTHPKDQIGKLFLSEDSYAMKDSELNIQDFNGYYLQLEWENGRRNASSENCGYGDKLLILKSHYNKYLTITDGHINTKQIATNITITGDNLVAVSDIKNWIREANTKTTP